MNSNDLIKEIRERIQFVVTIYILFSTVIYGFYKAIGKDELSSNSSAFSLVIGIACYILIYLLVGSLERAQPRFLIWLKHLINANLLFLVVPLIVFSATLHNALPGFYEWPFKISLPGTLMFPILVLAATVIFWVRYVMSRIFGNK